MRYSTTAPCRWTKKRRQLMKNINIGIVGAGFMAKVHSAAFSVMPIYFPDCPAMPVKKVLCDVSEDIAKPCAQQFGWQEWSIGIEEMIKRPDINLVDIVTPNFLHEEVAIAAAENGKMIFCEKPMAQNSASARRMYEAVKKAGVRTGIAFNKRRWPAVVYAKQLFDSGVLGDPLFFKGSYEQGTNLDPMGPFTWRFEKRKSGGLNEVGSHIVDMCRMFLGEYDEVVAVTDTHIKERPIVANPDRCGPAELLLDRPMGKVDVEESGCFLARMKSGVMTNISMTVSASGKSDAIAFELFCSKGAMKWYGERPSELWLSLESDPADQKGYKLIEMGAVHPYGGYALWPIPGLGVGLSDNKALEIYEFFSAITSGKEYRPDFYDGLKAVELIDTVMLSAETKKWEKVPE